LQSTFNFFLILVFYYGDYMELVTSQSFDQQIGPADDLAQDKKTVVIHSTKKIPINEELKTFHRQKSLQRKICLVRAICLAAHAFNLANIAFSTVNAYKSLSVGNNTEGAFLLVCTVASVGAILFNRFVGCLVEETLAINMLTECSKIHARTKFDNLIFTNRAYFNNLVKKYNPV
jgi:hypothetical protein